MEIQIIKNPISKNELAEIAKQRFGDLVKAVVDVNREIMAVGGNMYADEEAVLLGAGSRQSDLWGINIFPAFPISKWIEFDSVINIRPSDNNRSRGVENSEIRKRIIEIVNKLIK